MAVIRVDPLTFPFDTDSPFLFGVFHNDKYPKGNAKMGPDASLRGHNIGRDFATPSGLVHPRRGGPLRDGDGRAVDDGGAGISHAEMFPCLARAEENHMEFFQIWLNLPRAKKMSPPNFLMFWGEDIPTLRRGRARAHANEPVVQHGPFVGNTREDITKAFRDYQMTQFGSWPWPSDGVVHKRDDRAPSTRTAGVETKPRRATPQGWVTCF
ncbi:quercetin 2,3-dioxygenase [Aureococcus anophagefferens]|uniref:Quercetin 2,3-dioxygenase n=1 Tax=Aureococcus anophagefferens TaxID=44056 RepID=A0ABR1FLH8_AURAN